VEYLSIHWGEKKLQFTTPESPWYRRSNMSMSSRRIESISSELAEIAVDNPDAFALITHMTAMKTLQLEKNKTQRSKLSKLLAKTSELVYR